MLQTRSFLIALGVLFVHTNAFTNVALRQASHTSAQFAATTSDSAPSTPKQLTLFSPSKINLFLRILRKRSDGYHDLASLFQAIGFGDTLTLSILDDDDDDSSEATPHDILTCNMPGVPIDTSNLVVRALQLIREKTNSQVYFRASLIKQVPAKAGLGGGSANAATALYGANILLGRPATIKEVG
jgi:4-diphosphocytidyl-2-C-methyl-D-erythritol kinase